MTISTASLTDDSVEIYRGADFIRDYQLLDGSTPVDLTGASITCKFRNSDYSTVVFTAVGSLTDAANGKYRITIDAASTGAAVPTLDGSTGSVFGKSTSYQTLVFDVMILLSGVTYQKVRGSAKFYPSATV